MCRAMLVLMAGLSVTGARAFADLKVAWLPVSAPGLPGFAQSTEAADAPEAQDGLWNSPLRHSVLFKHPLERLANVQGEGTLRVMEDGTIVIVIEVPATDPEGVATDRRLVRMVPGRPEDTATLPDIDGMITIAYSAAEEIATVHANGELLFRFHVPSEAGSGEIALAEGYPGLWRGVEISARRLSPQTVNQLPIALIEAIVEEQLPVDSLLSVTDWRAAALELQKLANDPDRCHHCQAGGPRGVRVRYFVPGKPGRLRCVLPDGLLRLLQVYQRRGVMCLL